MNIGHLSHDNIQQSDSHTNGLVEFRSALPTKESVILYKLKARTHKTYISHRWNSQNLSKQVKEIEERQKLYNPFDYGIKHSWSTNIDWLNSAFNDFPTALLTATPLQSSNIMQQEHPYAFSAYAREIAFLLIRGYRGKEVYQVHEQVVQIVEPTNETLSEFESILAHHVMNNELDAKSKDFLILLKSKGFLTDEAQIANTSLKNHQPSASEHSHSTNHGETPLYQTASLQELGFIPDL